MTTTRFRGHPEALDALFRSLAADHRREIVRLVADRSETSVADLAATLASATQADQASDAEIHRRHTSLVHRDLPALTDVGLVAMTDEDAVVTAGDRLFDDRDVERVLDRRPADELDSVFEALAHSRRRTILAALRDRVEPVSVDTLARAVATREADTEPDSVPDDDIDRVLASLSHVHLRLVNDAGLVAYDETDGRVAYEGHPLLRTEWFEAASNEIADGAIMDTTIGLSGTAR